MVFGTFFIGVAQGEWFVKRKLQCLVVQRQAGMLMVEEQCLCSRTGVKEHENVCVVAAKQSSRKQEPAYDVIGYVKIHFA